MRGTLYLAVLTVKGSFARNFEEPVTGRGDAPNTVQWWIGDRVWRIVTYAIDHDIHVFRVGIPPGDALALALRNTHRAYAGVLGAEHTIGFADCTNRAEVRARFASVGLPPRLEVAPAGFAFWRADDAEYRTQSEPFGADSQV